MGPSVSSCGAVSRQQIEKKVKFNLSTCRGVPITCHVLNVTPSTAKLFTSSFHHLFFCFAGMFNLKLQKGKHKVHH